MKYGEILFLGKCNCNCYYCLRNEMNNLKKEEENQLKLHFSNWSNFEKYINICKKENIKKIFLSSVSSEPTLYKYLNEIIIKLKEDGFKVGIRSNGYFALTNINAKINEKMQTSQYKIF